MPEVQGLTNFLRHKLVADTTSAVVAGIDVSSISVLKTFDPPPQALVGLAVHDVVRHGKFIDLDIDGLHLIFHLARAGWVRWFDTQQATTVKMGKGPIALRARFNNLPGRPGDGRTSGFDLTEAGTTRKLAVYVVREPHDVPGIARLGPDVLADDFTIEVFHEIVSQRSQQLKGLLRDQSVIAGIGNAYSDEILHAAKLSPFMLSSALNDEQLHDLYHHLRRILTSAVEETSGQSADGLKDAKRSSMRIHGKVGGECPQCGDCIAQVSFADSSLQYCPTCQTKGKTLADRRMSKLLK